MVQHTSLGTSFNEINEFQVVHALITQSLKGISETSHELSTASNSHVEAANSQNNVLTAVCQTFSSFNPSNHKRVFPKFVKEFINHVRKSQDRFSAATSTGRTSSNDRQVVTPKPTSCAVRYASLMKATKKEEKIEKNALSSCNVKSSNVQDKVQQFEKQANSLRPTAPPSPCATCASNKSTSDAVQSRNDQPSPFSDRPLTVQSCMEQFTLQPCAEQFTVPPCQEQITVPSCAEQFTVPPCQEQITVPSCAEQQFTVPPCSEQPITAQSCVEEPRAPLHGAEDPSRDDQDKSPSTAPESDPPTPSSPREGRVLKRVPSERFQKMRRKVQRLMSKSSSSECTDPSNGVLTDEASYLRNIRIPDPTQFRSANDSSCLILRMPDHVLCNIFSLLDTRTLAAVKCSCTDFNFIINNFDVRATDSQWTKDYRYLADPCKQCRHTFVRGDMSMCRYHPKRYYSDLPYGRCYWMCCLQKSKSAPGCKTGLHDNHWHKS